jgi:signal transduction histidine kinase
MRYISHEIRTPLNTVFMGEKLISSAVIQMKKLLTAELNYLINFVHQRNDSLGVENHFFERLITTITESISEIDSILDTAQMINDSCNVALETLNDTLIFDKIDQSMLVLQKEIINPWKLVEAAAKTFKTSAIRDNIKYSCRCIDFDSEWYNNFVLQADRLKLNQVIRNLISNSIKFSTSGCEVTVKVEKKSSIDTHTGQIGNYVRISFHDTGCGISKENQKYLFGQYMQFNANVLQQGKGTGLGLWVCKSNILFF